MSSYVYTGRVEDVCYHNIHSYKNAVLCLLSSSFILFLARYPGASGIYKRVSESLQCHV